MLLEREFFKNKGLVFSCVKTYFGAEMAFDDDVVQAGYEGLWKALLRYQKDRSKLGQWAWLWVRKEAQKQLRGVCDDVGELTDVADSAGGVDEDIYVREIHVIIKGFLNKYLNELEKEVIVRRVMYEDSFEVIEEKLGVRRKKLYKVYRKAMKKLKKRKEELLQMLGGEWK